MWVRATLSAIAVGAVIGAAILPSANAHAASVDDSVCAQLRHGVSLASVEQSLLRQGLTPFDAGVFTGQQVRDRRPDVRDAVTAQAQRALEDGSQ